MAVKNKSASTLARLRNQAKEEGISYQMRLQLFFQEEFLRRLSHNAAVPLWKARQMGRNAQYKF